jgi:hypothetical protein
LPGLESHIDPISEEEVGFYFSNRNMSRQSAKAAKKRGIDKLEVFEAF